MRLTNNILFIYFSWLIFWKGAIKIKEKKTKYRYRLKFNIEKTEIQQKDKPHKRDRKIFSLLNYYRRQYNEAISCKSNIFKDPDILEIRNVEDRAKYVFESKDFKKIIEIAKKIKKYEKICLSLYLFFVILFSVAIGVFSFQYSNLYLLGTIPLFAVLFGFIFYPSISFSKFYSNIFVDVCVFVAGLMEKRDALTLKTKSQDINQMNNNTWMKPKKISSNTFLIRSSGFNTSINRIVVRDTVNHFYIKDGKIHLSKKKATVFTGYSFDLSKKERETDNKLRLALINKNTFFKTNAFTAEELENLDEISIKYPLLKDEWLLYVDKETKIDKKLIKYLQKQVIQLKNSIGTFNLYFFDNDIRILLSIKGNKDGVSTEYFKSSLKNPKYLTFLSFFANIKVLYIYYNIRKIIDYQRKYKPEENNVWKF